MKLEELQNTAEQDTTVDETGVGEFSLTLAHKTTKWLTLLSEERILFEALTVELGTMRAKRGNYYRYDYDTTLDNKKHLEELLSGDTQLNTIKSRVILSRERICFIEGIIKNLNQASFNMKNFIEWKKFSNGGY